ncbi:hypothetical protein [Emticicia fluvialis]|uniref:hypothetical protein n=1 Tax=Emticicia fluvialis TaxID=2974474 RepID=UPI0021658853|nr:hypothetical protein [Emticicia fluvialis]
MNEQINWSGYTFDIEIEHDDKNSIYIRVFDPLLPADHSAFELELRGLWIKEGLNFNRGDYYQHMMSREMMVLTPSQISYGSLTHNFLIHYSVHFSYIKNIYSTSLERIDDDCFITFDAIRFWNRQVEKGIATLVEDRYKIRIND